METIRRIFDDVAPIQELLDERYRLILFGDYKQPEQNTSRPSYVYIVFDNPAMDRTGANLGCVDVSLKDTPKVRTIEWETDVVLHKWSLVNVSVKEPYVCRIYEPGNLEVDGPDIDIDSCDSGLLEAKELKYMSMWNGECIESEASFVPTRDIKVEDHMIADDGGCIIVVKGDYVNEMSAILKL